MAQRSAELRNAQSTEQRAMELTKQKLISKQSAETAATLKRRPRPPRCSAAQANLEQATSALGKAGAQNAAVRAAAAKLAQANLDLAHTRVTAPATGLIANFEVRPGSMVQSGVPIFTVIGDTEYWVDANFKETELAGSSRARRRRSWSTCTRTMNSRAWCRACRAALARRFRCCLRRTRPATGSR